MIITRTPFRISFCGGGTDFPEFYCQEFGCVVSTAIDKFMYITLNRKFAGDIRVGYSKTEIVKSPDAVEHPIAREALKFLGVTGVEITSNADVPAGTGLGSSGSFTVGLINALRTYTKTKAEPEELAREANHVERVRAREIAGKQDYYIAAYGGLRAFEFFPDETVLSTSINYSRLYELNENLMLLYTGPRKQRAQVILAEQIENLNLAALKEIKTLAYTLWGALLRGEPPVVVGEFLKDSWRIKRGLAGGISNPMIDDYYTKAIQAGAIGGKLCGAGGGGFLLLYCPKEKQEEVKEALGLQVLPFSFEERGSSVIYNDTRVY